MNLAIVHLTDLHIRSSNDIVLTRAQTIAAAIKPRVVQADAIIVAVTGDLSFSGRESELLDASGFLDDLQSNLAAEITANICVAIIPGNHDCDFSVTGDLRRLLLRGVQQEDDVSPDTLDLLVKPLSQFFEIRNEFFQPTRDISSLAWSYEVKIDQTTILVTCLNTAWCSSLDEEQGKLFFPVSKLSPEPTDHQDLVIVMLHHPTPWMEARNGRTLRDYLEATADLVLTGHDHVPDQRFVTKPTGQSVQYIEGVALQDSDSSHTGFNLMSIDISAKRQKLWTFFWDPSDQLYRPRDDNPFETDLQVNRARKKNEFIVTDKFQDFLDDLGLQVTHPAAGVLTRSQVFKYPQLRRIRFRQRKYDEIIGSERLVSELSEQRLVLITGEEESGKTTLAKQLFEDLLQIDIVPIFMGSTRSQHRDFRSPSAVDNLIRDAVCQQYGSEAAERYAQLDRDQRAIIIDDYDKAAIPPDSIPIILGHLTGNFGRLYLLSDAMSQELRRLEVGELTHLENRKETAHYSILPFGFQRRNSMVEQWIALNPDLAENVSELVRQTELRNRMLDTVIGKNLVPAFPVYILGVLQASDSGDAVDLRASVNAHYYELFIKSALAVGADSIEYSIKTSFLAFLAYRMLKDNDIRMSPSQCKHAYREFREEYALTISYDALLSALRKSRLLIEVDGYVEFKYQYCFYYFAALYLTNNLSSEPIQRDIKKIADDIYEEQNANIFLFLAHLSEDSFILDQMLRCADGMFTDQPMATLKDDVSFLQEKGEELFGPKFWDVGDIRDLRETVMERRDEILDTDDRAELGMDRSDDYAATQEHIRKLGAAFKTLQILGQVLKNFPAAIRAERKEQIARAAYGAALRALSNILTFIERNQGAIVLEFMQRHLEEGDVSSYMEAFQHAKSSVSGLTRLAGLGAVIRIASALGGPSESSPSPSVRKVAEAIGSPVTSLTVFGMELDYTRHLPQQVIKNLHRELKDHRVAVSILQFVVVRHMHLFDVPYKDKEKACAELGIEYKRLQLRSADPRRKLIGPGRKKDTQ